MKPEPCPVCGHVGVPSHLACSACGTPLLFRCYHCLRLHDMGVEYCARSGRAVPSAWKTSLPLGRRVAIWRDRFSALRPLRLMALVLAALAGLWASRFTGPVPIPPVVSGDAPRIDVVFLIDSTGSMADEIDVVKQRVVAMMDDLRKGEPRPRVRFGVVTYRDRGDEYVVRTHPLTEDSQTIHRFVMDLVADGGGDMLENVNQGLQAAVDGMDWSPNSTRATRQIFLIGDAGPHTEYQDVTSYQALCDRARQMGIKIHVMGCSGITENGVDDFRQIASLGGGGFDFLTYRQKVACDDGSVKYTLFEGDKAYETEDVGDGWRSGARGMMAGGRARESYAPAPAAGPMENNLDSVLTEAVKSEARGMGVTY